MANISFYTRMTVDLLIEQKKFFGKETGWAFEILMILALFLIGFAFSGLTRSTLVKPKSLLWPGLLSTTALTGVLHRHGGLERSRFVVLHLAPHLKANSCTARRLGEYQASHSFAWCLLDRFSGIGYPTFCFHR